ncbi:unnamed protein product [Rotaria magnacalcarata]|uniref:RNA-directed DNA polymerase n=4 Tax=Rotaria magnacalcarata TaxID=392030 RepID=A0A816WTH9_9BILA|nr:unnamed protein product [Rotaria magnacalcarata]
MSWLRDTGAFIVKERYPETDHPFIIRHLLTDDALDYYLAHEDMIFNFYDLRKLLLHKQNVLAPLRTLPSLDSIATLSLTAAPPFLTSTQIPTSTTDKTTAMTTYTFAQSLEDLTQNDIRKTIIEDLQRNTAKFTGEHRQDVIKWLKTIEIKFDTAEIPTAKKFYLIPQLLDKEALDWFQEHKTNFNNSWSIFTEHFKRTFDSPNRARIAMQKLHSYTQSPYQDVRSFCSEMRKLFSEADPQMSSTMKLELLLAKVKPSYRLDLLKQKPKDPTEFETLAQDIENIYLVNEAIEQNTQFNMTEPVTDGPVSTTSPSYPSKPFLLYAKLIVNNVPLQTLIDTGASATCISFNTLQRMSNFRYIDTTVSSFVLADGVIPLQSNGSVELSMQFGNELIKFHAFVIKKLCVDLIIGMDFLIIFNANIDVKSQYLSLETFGRRTSIRLDDQSRRPLLPLHARHATIVPPHSTMAILASTPISSLSAYFMPTSSFIEHPNLSSTQKIVTVQHHHSHLLVTNSSDAPEHIPEFFCFGYLLSNPVGSQNFFNQIALLCRRYNEKKNQQTFNRTVTYSQLPQRLFNDSKRLYRSTPSINHVTLNTLPRFSSSQFQQTRDLLVNHLLDHDNKDRLLALLAQFSQLFDNSRHNISNIVVENVFNTVPHSPPSFRPHRNPHHREETQRLIDEFLEAGMIQESNSPYAAPAFIVPRKDNRPGRLVVDYRALNKITIPDASPLPHMEDLLQELGKGYKYFSRLDLKSGYHQFRIPTADRPKTAFVVSQGHYEFRVFSMGPQNAPAAFQKTMYAVMKSCREFCHVFLDDIIICSKSFDEHINHLKLAFDALAKQKLVLNASKCELAVQRVVVLGHTVSDTAIAPTIDAIQAILDLKEPRTLKETNKFLGGIAYYRKFVPHFSHIAAPIHRISNLTKDRKHLFKWTVEHSNTFHALKHLLTTAPLFLHFPIDDFPLHLATDASGTATRGVLFQDVNGERHNLFYHSKVLSPTEQKYSVPEKEALTIYHCLQRMRTLVLGRTVYIHTDHCPICGMLQKPVNNRRIERVANLIQEYRIAEMKHINGKSNCLADYLSRPSDDPLFDVDYGLESKLPCSTSSNLPNPCQPSKNILAYMTLRPRQKIPALGVSSLDKDDDLHGNRTHTSCYPGSCPKPIRLEDTSCSSL